MDKESATTLAEGYLLPGELLLNHEPLALMERVSAILPEDYDVFVPGWEMEEELEWDMYCLVIAKPLAEAFVGDEPVQLHESALTSPCEGLNVDTLDAVRGLCEGVDDFLKEAKRMVFISQSNSTGGNRGGLVFGQKVLTADVPAWEQLHSISTCNHGDVYDSNNTPAYQVCGVMLESNNFNPEHYMEFADSASIEYQSVFVVDPNTLNKTRTVFEEAAPSSSPCFYLYCEYG